MSEYNKEDIKNLHYNNVNEIQYEYGGQIYHCRMEHLKEILVTCWNLQQENKQLKERIDKADKDIQKLLDDINANIIIGLNSFIPRLEVIQDELVGGNNE